MPSNIQSFQWTGMNRQGKRMRGIIQAIDVRSAENELKAMDVEVISIQAKQTMSLFFWRPKVKMKEVVLFTRYLATMLSAGMPILQALEVIGRDQQNPFMKTIVTTLRSSVASGSTLADAMAQFPECFDDLYCNLTRAGEKSATLDKVLSRLVKYLEKIQRIRQKIKTALIYPTAIVAVATIVSLVLLLFVVPKFQKMFENANVALPAFTRAVIHLSDFLQGYWWLVFILFGFGIYGIRIMRKNNEVFADMFDSFMLRIFILGPIIKKAIIARFTRTLSITLDAGLPIVESMRSMVNIMGNRIYSKGILKVCDDISSGNQLSVALESTQLFPNMVIQMVAVGEASGALGEMLNNIATYYEEEVDTVADNLSTILEPLIIIILGVIIGAFVIAMYLPIFKLGSTI